VLRLGRGRMPGETVIVYLHDKLVPSVAVTAA
jgi:hypothetical protein